MNLHLDKLALAGGNPQRGGVTIQGILQSSAISLKKGRNIRRVCLNSISLVFKFRTLFLGRFIRHF